MTTLSGTTTKKQDLMATLGFSGVRMIPGPSSCVMIVQGMSGRGKTTLMSSNPDAFILNLDLSSTPGDAAPQATVWPGLNSAGRPVDPSPTGDPEDGKEIVLDYDKVIAVIDTLCEAAEKQLPGRPKMVVIDTLDVLQQLIMDHLLEKQQELRLSTDKKPDFYAIGQRGWTVLSDKILSIVKRLRSHGYGVCIIMQVGEKWVNDGVSDKLVQVRLVTPSVMKPLRTMAEMILTIDKQGRDKAVRENNKIVGKETVWTYTLSHTEKSLGGEGKTRRSLPETIELPVVGGWAKFEKVYAESIGES